MVKWLAALAAFGVLSVAVTQVALAQSARGQLGDDDVPADPALPPVTSSPAQPFDHLDSARLPSESPRSAAAAEAGLASPYAISANVVAGQSWARAVGGYDSAAQSFRLSSSAEAALTGRLVLRVDFDHGPATSATDRVSLGFRLQLLSQSAHGLDLGAGLFYQPNDFRREGNIVAALTLERRFNKVAVIGNALFGSDPEGDDRELDGRLATLVRINRMVEIGSSPSCSEDSSVTDIFVDAQTAWTIAVSVEKQLTRAASAYRISGPPSMVGGSVSRRRQGRAACGRRFASLDPASRR